MTVKEAPEITKYECSTAPDGYNFVIIENKEEEAVYKETVDYTQFDGLKMVETHGVSGQRYDISVGPGQTQVILMKADIKGFSMAAQKTSSVCHGDTKLKQMCLEEDNRT